MPDGACANILESSDLTGFQTADSNVVFKTISQVYREWSRKTENVLNTGLRR